MIKNDIDKIPQKLLTVQEAASYLGVHAGTIRRWAYSQRLKGTKIGERGDWRFDHHEVIKISTNYQERKNNKALIQVAKESNTFSTTHIVQFYENDEFLIETIKQFIKSGDTALVVAETSHKNKLEKGLEIHGVDVSTARSLGSYLCLDAQEVLSRFMINNMPDPDLFFEVIGGILTRVSRNRNNVKVFGEMVALLWAQGNQQAAIKLEELWNEIQQIHSFTLFCAYPMNGFSDKTHLIPFEKIGHTHSRIIPSETYSSLLSDDERMREVAKLQQKAKSLESEILKHRQTVEKLRKSEAFTRQIIENSADCIKVLSNGGALLSMNKPGCIGFEIEDIAQYLGKDYRTFWGPEYKDIVSNAIENAINGNIGRFQGFCKTAKGTPKWWDVIISPITTDKGSVENLIAISRDITAFKELEIRKDHFLSATSHELKTPLTSQKAFVQLLKREIEKNKEDKYVKYISTIHEQTNKLTKLVTNLLDVSKMHEGKLHLLPIEFDLYDLIQKSIEEINPLTNHHEIKLIGKFQKIKADKDKISQVIINLLTNAIKYSPKSSIITIKIKKQKNEIFVSVTDEGIGIDEQYQSYIFDRFYRVNDVKSYPGLGIGLYIASEIIKQHNGKIWVKSKIGKGSTFIFTLPTNTTN